MISFLIRDVLFKMNYYFVLNYSIQKDYLNKLYKINAKKKLYKN